MESRIQYSVIPEAAAPDVPIPEDSIRENPTTEAKIGEYLRSLGIERPARAFVEIVSNIFHGLEAHGYDSVHAEIHETVAHWRACLTKVEPALPSASMALDLGAGTGFASEQVLTVMGDRISWMVCHDLSSAMLIECKARIDPLTKHTSYVSGNPDCLLGMAGRFDLVVTNALLHHLLDIPGFFRLIRELVRPGGFYVAGHEPSSDFYADASVYRWTTLYRKHRRLRQLASPRTYVRRLRRAVASRDLEELTNKELIRTGILQEPLPVGVVRQLVDIHVPPPGSGIPFWGESGFNARDLCRKYLPDFEIFHLLTYPHIKDARSRMPPLWRVIDSALARRYPSSGANFLMAARRAG